jgi:hypothetical protein
MQMSSSRSARLTIIEDLRVIFDKSTTNLGRRYPAAQVPSEIVTQLRKADGA